jgi:uncharacterized SAM-binding protein YcdF (DUF218 family)
VLAGIALIATAFAFKDAGSALVVSAPVPRPDAIISLASHEWERLPATAAVAVANPSALVLLTLPEQVTDFNCHDCSRRGDRLRQLGVPSERVRILALTGPGTHGEAEAALEFVRAEQLRRLVVVTTPYHTRRALAVFRTVFEGSGVAIGILPASASSPAMPQRWWASPYDRAYVAYEWAAIIYYAAQYGVWSWTGFPIASP